MLPLSIPPSPIAPALSRVYLTLSAKLRKNNHNHVHDEHLNHEDDSKKYFGSLQVSKNTLIFMYFFEASVFLSFLGNCIDRCIQSSQAPKYTLCELQVSVAFKIMNINGLLVGLDRKALLLLRLVDGT